MFSTITTTICNMFFVRNKVTVYISVTFIVQICFDNFVHANTQSLSAIDDEPVQQEQSLSALPPRLLGRSFYPRARPQLQGRLKPRPGANTKLRVIGETMACVGTELAINRKFKDERYMQQQVNCLLDKGPCDKNGRLIKRIAPDVLKGHCPRPFSMCTKLQIKRVVAEVLKRFPREFSEISFSRKS